MAAAAKQDDAGAMHLRWPARLVLMLTIVFPSMAMTGISPILPTIAAHYADNPDAGALARLLVTWVGVVIAVCAPIAGGVADRFGYRRLFLIGLVVYALSGSAGFLIDDIYQLLASRTIMAMAAAAIGSTIFALVALHSTGLARSRWIGYLAMSGALSVAVLIPTVGFVAGYGWHLAFLVHALALLPFIAGWIWLDRDAPRPRAAAASAFVSPAQWPWIFIGSAFASGILSMTPLIYVPFHLRDIGVTEPSLIGMAMIPVTVCSASTAFLYGPLRSRLSITATFVLAFMLVAAGLATISLSMTFTQVLIGQAILGASEGMVIANTYALASVTGSDSQRAQMMGISKAGLSAGPMVGQIVLEPIMSRSDAGTTLMAIAVMAVIAASIHGWRLTANRAVAAGLAK